MLNFGQLDKVTFLLRNLERVSNMLYPLKAIHVERGDFITMTKVFTLRLISLVNAKIIFILIGLSPLLKITTNVSVVYMLHNAPVKSVA